MTELDPGSWEPHEERSDDTIGPGPAAAMHALLDAPGRPPGVGEALPLLWHWLYFLPAVAQAELGVDGHPQRGAFLPPVELPRRMFVGGRLHIDAPLVIGRSIARVGLVRSTTRKEGRSGALVFVTVGYDLVGEDGGALHEEQDLVYRDLPSGSASTSGASRSRPIPIDEGSWTMALDLPVDPVLLFRFSALTYNAHRIHYDRPWATGVEAYPGLVVHGPLQAIGLAELCRRLWPDRPIAELEFRAVSPAFDDGPLRLRGRPTADRGGVELQAFAVDGATTMTAFARWAERPS